MNDTAIKTAIAEVLQNKGFEVTLLEESDEPTPDLLATDQKDVFLIEIKERHGNSSQSSTPFEVQLDKICYQNRLSGICRKAVDQLRTNQNQEIFRLLWLIADPNEQHLHYEQFRATMYGIRLVVCKDSDVKEGYYIKNSEFYRWRDNLDGVTLGNFGGLFLNNYSPRYSQFRNTPFRYLFGSAVCDPPVIEKSGNAFYLDSDVDRGDELAVKKALESKYGIEVAHFENLVRFSV